MTKEELTKKQFELYIDVLQQDNEFDYDLYFGHIIELVKLDEDLYNELVKKGIIVDGEIKY